MILARRKWGIRARLFLAFGTIAGLTVAASLTAYLVLDSVGGSTRIITRQDVPQAILGLELAARAEALAAQAPNLLSATDQDQRLRRRTALTQARDELTNRLTQLAAFPNGRQAAAALSELTTKLNAQLDRLILWSGRVWRLWRNGTKRPPRPTGRAPRWRRC